ncbi:peptide deformylase [uncultured Algibacter sp.]|uniref:peptide deformylase n=1 Tax=uncultured Algibacter sp. TaxID=298659 RepID=UPI00262DEB94|nr:peptide deformylase [uncultured Algibacter sp.]
MANILPIAHLGAPILRERTTEVENITDVDFLNLIRDMMTTVKDANGLGIAGPQVYSSLGVFIMASKPSKRYPNAPKTEPLAIINPTILNYSKDKEKDWEGCLSIPGIRGHVNRSKSIEVTYTTQQGETVTKTLEGFIARIFQHEYDHLNGTVFLDRLDSNKDIISEKEYQRIVTT